MTRPTRTIVWMLVFLAAVAGAVVAVRSALAAAFGANPYFNGMILAVLAAGILVNMRQVLDLGREAAWIDAFRAGGRAPADGTVPRLLAPMARMLGRQGEGRFSLSALSMRSLLDGIRSRLDEARDVARYMTGLLIFLGLLGTFWGLLVTVGAVSDIIGGLSVGSGDSAAVFERLKSGLRAPLGGMGTAFSSSLFGLAGALVVGFLDLQAGHAQNRFFNELEEWLSGVTRLSSGGLAADGDGSVPAYVQALLEQTADSLDRLQRSLADGEQDRRLAHDRLFALTEQIARLTDQMRAEMRLFESLAETQAQLRPVLRGLADAGASGWDEGARAHLRNLDVGVTRISEEAEAGRERLLRELRAELRVLSRTIAAAIGVRHEPSAER
jgi:hypothetical protein